jgi:hypothetical protein
LFLRRNVRAGAVRTARAGAIPEAIPLALTVAFALALSLALTLAIRLRTAVGADAVIFFEAGGLPGGAFFLGLRRAAVALAVAFAALARPVLREGREGGSAHDQSRHHQSCECLVFHNCSFLCLFRFRLSDASSAPSTPELDHAWLNRRLVRGLQFIHYSANTFNFGPHGWLGQMVGSQD